jgi:nucleoside-diphosphate-sugar epimerase
MKILRILVLGGSGHIGKQLVEALKSTAWAIPVSASRRTAGAGNGSVETLRVDSRDLQALTTALEDFDAVVNCVAGDARSISEGARVLVQAALRTRCRRIVHLSTMSVYGPVEGWVREDAALDPSLGWYGQAKCEAEKHMGEFARRGGEAVVLRPGCVFGPGSELWVGRAGRWLQTGRLGDLGVAGDGWSNLVHVDDVCQALMAALQLPVRPGDMPAFNLAAPDSPRWNDYFVDLALALQATPVPRIGPRQLLLDALLAGPPLKAMQLAFKRLGRPTSGLPDPMPPGLLRLWAQHIHLDATLAEQKLGVTWTPYAASLQSCADWFTGNTAQRSPPLGNAVCTP